ncbi:hypothetical protein DET57_102200 [Klebsiella oxytoca]|uniref:Uncharacterized protein n=2 Tax=Klebsiella oxytoca TaxID=571 RepID=A0A318GA18_KLEOX|nr:hypothetical protein DET57_102200 [Klebsiella oxytoca]
MIFMVFPSARRCAQRTSLVLGSFTGADVFRLAELVQEKELAEFLPQVLLCQYRNEANLIGAAVSLEQKQRNSR